MPRVARIIVSGYPHHITQRGNNRQDVFFVADDRRVYLTLLQEQAVKYDLSVQGWCLMDNHVHLIATPADEESLARAVGRTHFLYTQYINRFHGRSGHLWQNRFFSCPLNLNDWRKMSTGLNWKNVLREAVDESEAKRIRLHTHRGRPLGSDKFLSKMERRLGRRLRPLPVGRPKDDQKKEKGDHK